jgi:glutaredoxin-like protein NrdH
MCDHPARIMIKVCIPPEAVLWILFHTPGIIPVSLQPGSGTTIGERNCKMAEKPVKIYSLSTCSHCKSTKKFLSDCTVQYDFVDVDLLEGSERKAILEDVKKLNPKCSFPTIIIGEKVIVGYKEDEIKEALGL